MTKYRNFFMILYSNILKILASKAGFNKIILIDFVDTVVLAGFQNMRTYGIDNIG